VERSNDPRRRLIARTDYHDLRSDAGLRLGQRTEITPAFVRRAILTAVAAGWNPSTPGKPFKLDIDG
jgi:hypothetical protein